LHGGYIVCECCGFDFTKAYDIDDEYIEIHHRFPFSQTEGEHPVNSQTDLVPLCANCHRMIHHGQGGKGNCMSAENGGYPPTQNGDIRSLFWLFSLMALQN